MIKKIAAIKRGFIVVAAGCLINLNASAAVLEMPDVRDSTPLKGKSVYENIDIPPVRERNPNPEAGPRVWVLQIKLQGVVDRAKFGILKTELESYAEKLRSGIMKEAELLKYGYSLEDLGKIADLMVDIDAGKDLEQVTEPDVQRLLWLVRELKESRGLTMANIEDIAAKLTNYYRERGFFLARVYVPQQEVRRGVVVLAVLEGTLGTVTISGNQHYDSAMFAKAFDNLLYQPVTEQEIEQKLYLLNDFPGLDIYGYFKAGDQVGDTWLNLTVRGETRMAAIARYDNHGSDLTGRQRLYGEAQFHNPLNLADNLSFSVLKTFEPDEALYGALRYRLPVYSEAYHVGLSYSRNQFATVINILEFTGDTAIAELGFDVTHVRRKEKNLTSSLSYARKDSDLIDTTAIVDLSDLVQTLTLGVRFDALNSQSKILNQVSASVTGGEVLESQTLIQSGEDKQSFSKMNADYSILAFLTIPWVEASSRLIFKSTLQYSADTLPPVEQYSIAGPNKVRAYEITQFSADSGIYAGIDWIFNFPGFLDFNVTELMPFSSIVQPFVFLDYSYGELNQLTGSGVNTGELSGYGFGFQLNYKNKISGNLQFAFPIDYSFNQESISTPDEDLRIIADVQYVFN